VAIVRYTSQGICDRLLTEVILEFALFGYILNNNFVAVPFAFIRIDFAPTQSDLEACAILPSPGSFHGIDSTVLAYLAEQLRSLRRFAKNIGGEVRS
jgi:hypothetical protein